MSKDENYEFSEKVYNVMIDQLSRGSLGLQPLQYKEGYLENNVKTVIACLSDAADLWYSRNANPRTVLFAVAINTVDEYLDAQGTKYDDPEFWNNLLNKVCDEKENIEDKVKKLKNGDKLDIDAYHREVQEKLEC